MKDILTLFETYILVLIHPFKIHQQFRHNLPLHNCEETALEPLSLGEALSVSWIFSIVKAFGKVLILNFFLQIFWHFQANEFPILKEIIEGPGFSAYYFFLFSIFLDLIFFPILTFITSEIWSFFIKHYARLLNPNLDAEKIADQIVTHALSSHLFSMIPIIGDFIQIIFYHFLLYAGLRANLETTRSLAILILVTPLVLIFMLLTILSLGVYALF